MIPNFLANIIMYSAIERKKAHYDYLRFLETKAVFLEALGLVIYIPGTEGDKSAVSGKDSVVESRYEIVKAGQTYLSAKKQELLRRLKKFHDAEKANAGAASAQKK